MNLLLDTHTFIWFYDDPSKLSSEAREALSDSANIAFLSIVSVWEMQIKSNLGKLTLQMPIREAIGPETGSRPDRLHSRN